MGYYRKFISDYASPLTDMTLKNKPDKITWTDMETKA